MKIELKNIKPTYMSEKEVAFSDIYLQDSVLFSSPHKYLIKAQSGKGKSSLLNFIYSSNKNYSGKILYDYSATENFDIYHFRKYKISYVFQDFKLFDDLSVWDNILLKNNLTNHKTFLQIESLLNKVGLAEKKNSLVKNISLGQKQRVAVIRAICQPFQFLLLDEPFSHLDVENIKIITQIIENELNINKAGLLLTTLGENYYFDYDRVLNL